MSTGFGERPIARLRSKGGTYKEGAVCSKMSVCTFVIYYVFWLFQLELRCSLLLCSIKY